jgi:hypothetical protein
MDGNIFPTFHPDLVAEAETETPQDPNRTIKEFASTKPPRPRSFCPPIQTGRMGSLERCDRLFLSFYFFNSLHPRPCPERF